jgi:hypothetical protein
LGAKGRITMYGSLGRCINLWCSFETRTVKILEVFVIGRDFESDRMQLRSLEAHNEALIKDRE